VPPPPVVHCRKSSPVPARRSGRRVGGVEGVVDEYVAAQSFQRHVDRRFRGLWYGTEASKEPTRATAARSLLYATTVATVRAGAGAATGLLATALFTCAPSSLPPACVDPPLLLLHFPPRSEKQQLRSRCWSWCYDAISVSLLSSDQR
jgi:hypothetical protein